MSDRFHFNSDTLVIKFDNIKAANHFKLWLCEQGEQDYWQWMENSELDESGNITGLKFDYFQCDVIPVKCGRLTNE